MRKNRLGYQFLPSSLLILFLFLSGCLAGERLFYASPALLPRTEMDMKTPGFWISRHPFPDRVIMNEEEVRKFNEHIRELRLTIDIAAYPDKVSGKNIAEELEKTLQRFEKKEWYFSSGRKVSHSFYRQMRANMCLEMLTEERPVRFGLVVRLANQRLLPTDQGFYARAGSTDFDELQNSSLDPGTPVAILHQGAGAKWYYGEGPLSSGWIKAEDFGFCSRAQVGEFCAGPDFVVVIKPKAQLFGDADLIRYLGFVHMGMRLPLIGRVGSGAVRVLVPIQDTSGRLKPGEGFIKSEEVHEGFLPYTSRTILQQAFEFLDKPYGWGGMYGEQDCSEFVREIFSTTGVILPRNSSDQVKVGIPVGMFSGQPDGEETKRLLMEDAVPGITLLGMKGHIMFFLGIIKGNAYVIHGLWGYTERAWLRDTLRVVRRVVVTDLSLGMDTRQGTFLKRVSAVRLIALP